MVLVSACKQLQENQAVAWILKTKEKIRQKQESLVFLEMTVHMVGEKAENQWKTREKSKVAETKCFGWISAQKMDSADPQDQNDKNNPLKVVTNEKGEAVGDVLTIIC